MLNILDFLILTCRIAHHTAGNLKIQRLDTFWTLSRIEKFRDK